MPRELSDELCEVTFNDRISNSKITLYYRLPTTDERIAYQNAQVVRRGNKIKNMLGETRQKYGLAILEGISAGSFTKAKKQPLSSDPQSPHYDAKWKSFIATRASDVVNLLAIHVFEASVITETIDDTEDEPPIDGEKGGGDGDKEKGGSEGKTENPL